ncbi:sigma-70 family RNA polymerase sigma factor [Azotobacter vinelandii]
MSSPTSGKLESFFNSHHHWLLRHVQRQLSNRADAEDTASETFCQVLSSRIDTDEIRQPRAYLSTIARRLMFDRYRRRQLEKTYLDYLATLPEGLAPSAEERTLLQEALTLIDRTLDGLPLAVKTAFLYSQIDGLGYTEIAQLLGVSERTVRRYMKQALSHCYLIDLP